ncbi:tryptophan 7-halogenase [Sphingomonas psychrotolerans]|uniref:Tryptophan 7-halogenase n=1 Tax=Sphingomonas psychrotolerans TaxID=1327635 RepID=A0ABU3NAW9_9SPHN|nr:tryptophan 7-halogenase [Sphingomonas psychrotolerans]MDT8761049.1 tryptophan 7-halogenase [Sphingomonas psychrotolerans]
MNDRAIRSIAILGGGIVGLSAAAAFARALPQISVTLIEAPADPAALADLLPGSTSAIHRFHARIGLDEQALIRAGAALPRLGLRFVDWPAGAESWHHVHGEHGAPAGKIAFHQLWARARRAGSAEAWHRYAPAGVLAEARKFLHPQPGTPLAAFDYGLRLEPVRYREMLTALVDRAGVTRLAGRFEDVVRHEDGGVAALMLADGRRVEADLYVDASGPAAPLANAVTTGFEDWASSLPYERVEIGEGPPSAADPNDTIIGAATGWQFVSPLPGRTILGRVHASAEQSDAPAVTIRRGRRNAPWAGNVLALGDAAVALDPLHWPNLHLAQSGIARAIELLPGRDFHPVETAEYNRRARLEAEHMRDFQALHYWRAGADIAVPDSLTGILDQFTRRGRFVWQDEDSVTEDEWLSALLGLGMVPEATDPVAEAVPIAAADAGMAELRKRLAQLPAGVPGYAEYLKRCGVPA